MDCGACPVRITGVDAFTMPLEQPLTMINHRIRRIRHPFTILSPWSTIDFALEFAILSHFTIHSPHFTSWFPWFPRWHQATPFLLHPFEAPRMPVGHGEFSCCELGTLARCGAGEGHRWHQEAWFMVGGWMVSQLYSDGCWWLVNILTSNGWWLYIQWLIWWLKVILWILWLMVRIYNCCWCCEFAVLVRTGAFLVGEHWQQQETLKSKERW